MMPASSPQHGIEYPETTRCQAWRTFRCCQLRMHRTGSARYVRCRGWCVGRIDEAVDQPWRIAVTGARASGALHSNGAKAVQTIEVPIPRREGAATARGSGYIEAADRELWVQFTLTSSVPVCRTGASWFSTACTSMSTPKLR